MSIGRRRVLRHAITPTVSLTPLIDTALTLLVVFMVAAPVAHHAVRVELPRSESEDTIQSEAPLQEIVISVDQHDVCYFDGKKVERTEVRNQLMELIRAGKKQVSVYIAVDRRASAGVAIELLTALRGIEGVADVALNVELAGSAQSGAR